MDPVVTMAYVFHIEPPGFRFMQTSPQLPWRPSMPSKRQSWAMSPVEFTRTLLLDLRWLSGTAYGYFFPNSRDPSRRFNPWTCSRNTG